MEAGGVCLQKWRRRRRKRSETPAETVSKGWGGPSPPPGHGERPPGRDGMGCAAGRAEGPAVSITAPGAGRREGKSPAEPSRARRHAADVRHREKGLLFSSSSHAPRG